MINRITALRNAMEAEGCDAYFSLAAPANEYLAGFRGSASALLITPEKASFICDFRYTEQAAETVQGFEIEECNTGLEKRLGERLSELGIRVAAYDSTVLTVEQQNVITAQAPDAELKPAPRMLSRLRQVKSPEEIARIRAANDLAEGVLADVLAEVRPGVAEREIAARMEYEFKRRGASGASFSPIVLFGARTSLPHGVPGETCLKQGDIVLMDFGCILQSYCSDLTRTFVSGTIPGTWFDEIYHVTLEAQLAALAAVRPGVPCVDVDRIARDIIADAGYGDYFGHGLGHGVGLEIHEGPRLNRLSDAVLEAGMIVTIEPGIYLPGKGGVRIEDIVAVTETGCDVLSKTPKALKVLQA